MIMANYEEPIESVRTHLSDKCLLSSNYAPGGCSCGGYSGEKDQKEPLFTKERHTKNKLIV